MRHRVCIIGCGYVGSALAEALVPQHDVYGLRRNIELLPDGVTPISADISSQASIDSIPSDLTSIVYAVSADTSSEQSYRAAYVTGVCHALAAAKRSAKTLKLFALVSSTRVYTESGGAVIDETSDVGGKDFKPRSLLAGEQLLIDSGLPRCIARCGGIYGPGRDRLIQSVRTGTAQLSAAPQWTNRIHRDDVAGVLQQAIVGGQMPQLLNLVDCAPVARNEVLEFVAEAFGSSLSSNADDTAPVRGSKRVSNRRLLETGYQFRYPTYREGYQAQLRQMGV